MRYYDLKSLKCIMYQHPRLLFPCPPNKLEVEDVLLALIDSGAPNKVCDIFALVDQFSI